MSTTIQRNTTVDLARLFASFGVVAIHVHNSTPVAQAIGDFVWPLCVPFFYAVSLTYFVAGLSKSSTNAVVARAWWRLTVPYLVWTAIYTGLLLTKHLLVGQHPPLVWWRILFYGESAVHLYFLPELLLQQALALACFLLLSSTRRSGTGFVLLLGIVAYIAWGISHQVFALGQLVSIGTYLLLAFWLAPQLAVRRQRWLLAAPGILLTILAIGINMTGQNYLALGYPLSLLLGGIGLLLTTIGLPGSTISPAFALLSSLSFGIYLSHVIFLEAFELFTERLWPPTGIYYTGGMKLLVTILTFASAALFTWLAHRYAVSRQLLLGERI